MEEWASWGGEEESLAIASHQDAIALRRRFAGVLRLLDLRYQELKSLAHVLVVPRARLGPAALDLLGELLSVLGGDLPLLGSQIALVAHDDDGDRLGALDEQLSAFLRLVAEVSLPLTRWFRIFSRMTCTISNEGSDDTE